MKFIVFRTREEPGDKRSQATASRFQPVKGGLALERGGNSLRAGKPALRADPPFPRHAKSILHMGKKSTLIFQLVAGATEPFHLVGTSVVRMVPVEFFLFRDSLSARLTTGRLLYFSEADRFPQTQTNLSMLLTRSVPPIAFLLVLQVDVPVVAPLAPGKVARRGRTPFLDVEVGYRLASTAVPANLAFHPPLWHGSIVPAEGEILN